MKPSGIVTLTTDFGHRDSYVGQMKGAALAVASSLELVDLCHAVPPHDVSAGAYLLETGYAAFPEGTTHLAVVDPGVGTRRRALVVRTDRYYFVGPDNGLLSRVLEREPARSVNVLAQPEYRREETSATFEGRDVFAPAAAWIARGVEPERLGPAAGDIARLPGIGRSMRPGMPTRVPVIWIDHFGNAVVDVRAEVLIEALGHAPASTGDLRLATSGGEVREFRRTYADGSGPGPFLLINSAGYLELALDSGPVDRRLNLSLGTEVELTVGPAEDVL
jgi:S-adenosylmethionine hydrolase